MTLLLLMKRNVYKSDNGGITRIYYFEPIDQLIVLWIRHKLYNNTFIGGMVTVMNAEGKPVQVPAGALQAANVQNHIGTTRLNISNLKKRKDWLYSED